MVGKYEPVDHHLEAQMLSPYRPLPAGDFQRLQAALRDFVVQRTQCLAEMTDLGFADLVATGMLRPVSMSVAKLKFLAEFLCQFP